MPSTDPAFHAPLVRAARASAWLAKQVELALQSVDLTPPQYRILTVLGSGSASATDAAERLAVSPPSVTAIVDGLVARSLVGRCMAKMTDVECNSASPRRVALLSRTPMRRSRDACRSSRATVRTLTTSTTQSRVSGGGSMPSDPWAMLAVRVVDEGHQRDGRRRLGL